jgi:hypothetical protein
MLEPKRGEACDVVQPHPLASARRWLFARPACVLCRAAHLASEKRIALPALGLSATSGAALDRRLRRDERLLRGADRSCALMLPCEVNPYPYVHDRNVSGHESVEARSVMSFAGASDTILGL